MKVAGTIDHYEIDCINLAKLGDEEKFISINADIRKAINKAGGDTVIVTLYMLNSKVIITEKEILNTFQDSGVLKAFQSLSEKEQAQIIDKIKSLKSEEEQVKMILKYMDHLGKGND